MAISRVTLAATSFSGSNLYYASGLKPAQQQILLAGLQSAGVKVLRVWLDGVSGTVKGTPVDTVPSLEGDSPGGYDDTVLNHLDDFMAVANGYGIKLLVSLYSYNALAANSDFYGKYYGTGDFYTNSDAINYYKQRVAHIMAHVNPHNGKPWSQSSEYIFAFETQNEAMHDQASWQCNIAGAIRSNLAGNTNILVSTGGGAWLANSLLDAYFSCDALDVLAIHAYGVGDFATSTIQPYVSKAQAAGKKLIMQEWGACYTTAENNNCNGGGPLDEGTRGSNIKQWAGSIAAAGVPQFYWQILPNEDPHQDWDYEVGVGGVNWDDLKGASLDASQADAAFDFGPWLL
ncbi:glycoside hydrolase family 5 protein [Myriangium duriaei CBS 260.36]|uniref:mannan endo-1,4-beta-mannosidase n=1 Tax=Myriangium duriaei CBS 260.36 TaxID=1168546 RepID=A0A9P4J397_9PEZI|nr:glycoside hydrolase family 5 protein [Myriangium duriaei CBS 260.36]